MIVSKIANVNIGFELLSREGFYNNILKYEVNEEPELIIKSNNEKITIEGILFLENTFYDLYNANGKIIQIQKRDGKIVGKIAYGNPCIISVMNDYNLNEYLLTQYIFQWYFDSNKKALFIHGSSVMYNNMGYLFSAKSGTGKSTHAKIWTDNTEAISINDDKNIVIEEDNILYLYGNPWSGKSLLDNNVKAPLKAVIYIFQNDTNIVKRLDKKNSFIKMLQQVIRPNNVEEAKNWDEMTTKLLDIPTFEFGCNMDISAMETIKKELEELK